MKDYWFRRFLTMTLISGLVAGCATVPVATSFPTDTPVPAPALPSDALVGVWIGGFDVPGAASTQLIEISIALNGTQPSGAVTQYLDQASDQAGGVPDRVTGITVENRTVALTISHNGVEVTLDGDLADDGVWTGTATSGVQTGKFELARATSLTDESLAEWEGEYFDGDIAYGLYRVEQGFSASKIASFWLVNLNTGQWRLVVPTSDDTALVGAGFGIAYPADGSLSFERDGDGKITAMHLDRADLTTLIPRTTFKTEEVPFLSGDLTLAGRITLPDSSGPHPAVVLVHGSERRTRDGFRLLTALLAMRGVAAFAYDKRGVGDSEGSYIEAATDQNIANLAGDAESAVATVAARADIIPTQVGVWGASQAGWVIPVAATESPGVAFVILTSGPVVSVSEEDLWSSFTSDGGTPTSRTFEDMEAEVDTLDPLGVDSQPYIQEMKIPGLWIFGELDRSIPVRKSVRNLERIKQVSGGDLTWVILPGGNHQLFETPDGMNASFPYSDGFVPGYIDTIFNWLLPRVTAGR